MSGLGALLFAWRQVGRFDDLFWWRRDDVVDARFRLFRDTSVFRSPKEELKFVARDERFDEDVVAGVVLELEVRGRAIDGRVLARTDVVAVPVAFIVRDAVRMIAALRDEKSGRERRSEGGRTDLAQA